MSRWSEQLRQSVSRLIATCEDADGGFRRAAAAVIAADTKALLLQCAAERRQFASMLRLELRRAGEEEPAEASSGTPAQQWSALDRVPQRDEHAVMTAVEAEDTSALDAYRAALETPSLPADLRALVQLQYRRIAEVHQRLGALRDSTAVAG